MQTSEGLGGPLGKVRLHSDHLRLEVGDGETARFGVLPFALLVPVSALLLLLLLTASVLH
jgi:hypothetical protein